MTTSPIPATAVASRVPGQSALGSVAGFCYDHRRIWALALIGVTLVSQAARSRYSDSFSGGNSQHQQVQNPLQGKFPSQAGSLADAVIRTAAAFSSPPSQAATASMVAALRGLSDVAAVTSSFSAAGARQVSKDGHIGFAVVQFDEQATSLPDAAISQVIAAAESLGRPGYTVALGGIPVSQVVTALPGSSETCAIVAAIVITLLAFGSVVAMGLPILTAVGGIVIGFAADELTSHMLTVPAFGPELLIMLGLGSGTGCALFIVTRYRQGLHDGTDPRDVTALATPALHRGG